MGRSTADGVTLELAMNYAKRGKPTVRELDVLMSCPRIRYTGCSDEPVEALMWSSTMLRYDCLMLGGRCRVYEWRSCQLLYYIHEQAISRYVTM